VIVGLPLPGPGTQLIGLISIVKTHISPLTSRTNRLGGNNPVLRHSLHVLSEQRVSDVQRQTPTGAANPAICSKTRQYRSTVLSNKQGRTLVFKIRRRGKQDGAYKGSEAQQPGHLDVDREEAQNQNRGCSGERNLYCKPRHGEP
jgi:hypothetical protein